MPKVCVASKLDYIYNDSTYQYLCASRIKGADTAVDTTTKDRIDAFPLYIGRNLSVDQAVIQVTTSRTGGACRIALYDSTSTSNIYPKSLIQESDEISCTSTGVKTVAFSANLDAGMLYWACVLNTASLTMHTLRSIAKEDCYAIGSPDMYYMAMGFYVDYSYGAYPADFPAGASYILSDDDNAYSICFRVSA